MTRTGMTEANVAWPVGRRLETPRLMLEPIRLATARALLDGSPVADLVAGPGWPQPDTLNGLRMDVATADAVADGAERTGWFVVLRQTGQVIGDCGWYGGPDEQGDAELGYGLAAPFRGQGYGTELVRALVGWCAGQPGVRRIVAEVLPGNTPSRRVLAAAGFTEIVASGDHLRYAWSVPAASVRPVTTGEPCLVALVDRT